MRVSIERNILLKALSHVQSVVERRATIQIISHVLIEARDDEVTLTATDLDIEIVERIPARVMRAGATTTAAAPFYEIVRKLSDGAEVEVDLSGDDPRLKLSADRGVYQLAVLGKKDFPLMDQGGFGSRFAIGSKDLARLMTKARFAISTEETRYYLNGIYLHAAAKDGQPVLRAVATDGHRLAQVEMPAPSGSEGMPGVIVPRKTVLALSGLINDADVTLTIALSPTKVQFAFDTIRLTSKLIDGTFPDYERVIPKHNDLKLLVSGSDFSRSVDRVSSISLDKTRAVKLALADDTLTLMVTNPESGNAREELSVSYSAEPMEVGFNARYLLDITDQLEGDDARFSLADPGAPAVIEDLGDPQVLYVLMPMRV